MRIIKPKKTAKPDLKPETTVKLRPQKREKRTALPQEFGLHNLKMPKGAHKRRKILGRGPSSGHGKTSTRGSKGQTSRAGRDFYAGFEGGQTPLIRRIPKRGFTHKKKEYQIVNLRDLNRIKEPSIDLLLLEKRGLIKDKEKPVKILGEGKLENPVTVQAHAFSRRASQEITHAGGKIEVLSPAADSK